MLNLDGEVIGESDVPEEKKSKVSPFSFVEAINYTKDLDLYTDNEKSYTPYIINKALSFHPDTVVQANIMNKYHGLDKDIQFRFLTDMIRKRKRYGGWIKKVEDVDKIETIKAFYKYSTAKAIEVADLLSDADLSVMKQRMSQGGLNARTQSS